MRSKVEFAFRTALSSTLLIATAAAQNDVRSGPASSIVGSSGQQQTMSSTFIGGARAGQSTWGAGKGNFVTAPTASGTKTGIPTTGTQAAKTSSANAHVPLGVAQSVKQQGSASLGATREPKATKLPMPASQSTFASKTARSSLGTKHAGTHSMLSSSAVAHKHGTGPHARGGNTITLGSTSRGASKQTSGPATTFGGLNGQFGRTKP